MWKSWIARKDRRKDRTEVPIQAVQKQLEHVAREGGFKAVLLTTEDGFTVADIESKLDSESLAALAGFVWEMTRNAVDLTGFESMDQITMGGASGDSVICRSFDISGQPVVLTVIAEAKSSYRHLTDQAVEGIRRILA
jgi:predicted regulator of Ras-like GTPase activity (Roadblock/LC7/MglB family)